MARPKAAINAKQILKLASDGWKITEMADFFGCDRDTISERFSAEITKGKATLKGSLRKAQIKAARMGNGTMLVWLGKQYLGQADESIDDYLLEAIKTAGLEKEDLLTLIQNKDQLTASKPKKSFHDFCKTAGYPAPYDRQVEMRAFIIDETVTRMLLGARGYGKTDYTVILGTAYDIYLHPETATTLVVTKSRERNAAMIQEIQEACEKNGVVFDRASSTRLRARGLHGKDPSISAVTIKTVSLRGRHPQRVIMDDPVTEDDTGDATRRLAKKKYNEIMKLTQNVAIIGQPAHQYDLYAELRGIVKTLEIPHGSIPELDADLEAQKLAGVDEASISASYHLKILTEGTLPFHGIKMLDVFPRGDSVAFIDPSEGGDYTALAIVRAFMQGVAVVGFAWKKAWNHCLDDMQPKLQQFGVKRLAFETNKTGNQPVQMLRELWPGLGIVGIPSVTEKHSTIMAAGAYSHLIHLSKESDKTFTNQVVRYEYDAEFDDSPDSLARCLQWLGLIRGKSKRET